MNLCSLDRSKELQKSEISRSINRGGPKDRYTNLSLLHELLGYLFSFKLTVLVDVTWAERSRFGSGRVRDVSMYAYRTAMDKTLNAPFD